MDKKPPSTASKASGTKKTDHTSVGAGVRQQINVRMMQNVLLIWLDANIDEENSADCRNTVTQLRLVVNTIDTFTDGDECIQFIKTKNEEKACMIISGSLGKLIVPRVHNMSQVDSIFIFCGNKKHHEQWVKEWPKIKGVFTEITLICEALKNATKECEQNAIPMSFVATSGDMSNKNLNQLDNSFMYTQIMKEILLAITFEDKHIKELIEHCREQFAGNDKELQNINQLERKYRQETPIWWYTYECFLYPMLNRALRHMDVDVIIKMGFFIGDLHRHIKQLHEEQFSSHHSNATFTVYRGQGMSEEAFEQMQQTNGGLVSFNSFLSTSKDCDVSRRFARGAATNPDLVGVLFVMKVDPSKSTAPFASIIDVSYFQGQEDEVLFSMHTIFRIRNIKSTDGNHRLFQVDLTLTDDNDNDLRVLTDYIRDKTFPNSEGWYRLGVVLRKMGESEKSEQVYQTLLEQTTDESGKAAIYGQLGGAKYNQGNYKEAIAFYKKALAIYQKTPSNHPNLAATYNNIGLAYDSMGDYPKALSSHEKALAIRQQSFPSNHPDLAASYNNIGNVHYSMGDYPKALSYYEKDLAISQQSLPSNHPNLGASYNNIGNVYENMGDYPKARSFLERAVDIGRHSLPANHPNLQQWRKNFENAKKKL